MVRHQIRRATANDATALSALIQDAVRTSNSRDYSKATIELICANFTREKVIGKMTQRDVFVAFNDHGIVGTISRSNSKLHSMFVSPRHQGGGIGRSLVEYLERHAVSMGVSDLWLSSSITAKPFYLKLGYELVQFEERPDGSTFLMKKSFC
jgi:putative acetyltransferase